MIEIVIAVLLLDIAVSLRRRLHSAAKHRPLTWTWLYPPDWPYLIVTTIQRRKQ